MYPRTSTRTETTRSFARATRLGCGMKNARCSANDGRLREDVIGTQDPRPDGSHVRFLRADAVRSVEFPFLGHVGFLHVTSVPPVLHVSLCSGPHRSWPSLSTSGTAEPEDSRRASLLFVCLVASQTNNVRMPRRPWRKLWRKLYGPSLLAHLR